MINNLSKSVLSDNRVTNIMAAKTGWYRYGTKLRHCHPMYRRDADSRDQWTCRVIAKFHYTCPTGPARTFFAARVSEKLRWVRAVSDKVRAGPCGSGRARVVEFSLNWVSLVHSSVNVP